MNWKISFSAAFFLKKTAAIGVALLIAVSNLLSLSLAAEQEVSIEEMLRRDIPKKTESSFFVIFLFHKNLDKRVNKIIPASALDLDSYRKLYIEMHRLVDASEGKNQRQILEDATLGQEIEYLAETVVEAANPMLTGRCQNLGIDLDSAKKSQGDWRLVKIGDNSRVGGQVAGTPIKPSSFFHINLHRYYRLGCGGKKDLATARKVLFDISDLEPPHSKERSDLRAEFRHCVAEVWARYGIGGPIDLLRAEQFSRRYTKATFLLENEDTPELRAEMAAQFPEAAKRNFECPRADYYRDPRDPWLRLW